MRHIDLFQAFFAEGRCGTAREIHDYLIQHGATFKCRSGEIEDEVKSVNRQISGEIGKQYPTGIVSRRQNVDGIYEYYTTK